MKQKITVKSNRETKKTVSSQEDFKQKLGEFYQKILPHGAAPIPVGEFHLFDYINVTEFSGTGHIINPAIAKTL